MNSRPLPDHVSAQPYGSRTNVSSDKQTNSPSDKEPSLQSGVKSAQPSEHQYKKSAFTLLSRWLRRIFGYGRCTVCTRPLAAHDFCNSANSLPICTDCAHHLRPRTGGYCPRCGELYASDTIPPSLCSRCITTPPRWEQLTFLAPYEDFLRHCILDMKFHGRLELAPLLGHLLAQQLLFRYPQKTPDIIIPIPLHHSRLCERGYNQSLEFARPVAKALRIPLLHRALVRTRATQPQTGLDKKSRMKNLSDVFAANTVNTRNKHVLLVDDILTTGATLDKAAACLIESGAAQVDVAVIARTPAPDA